MSDRPLKWWVDQDVGVEVPLDVEGRLRRFVAGGHRAGLLPDWMIRQLVGIEEMAEREDRPGKISYGLTSYGYDARVGYRFKVFSPVSCAVVDPKAIRPETFHEVDLTEYSDEGSETYVTIPPNSYVLGETVERFKIPRDVLAICVGKSTYARCGIIVNVTPLEPEWEGKVTVEISNSSPLPAKVYAGEGIMQILFFRAMAPCEVSYADKKGIYQGQSGLTDARVRS
jgi:dCTP deaminase